ncbi:hypothetical protein LQF12_05020 [Ruania suaedae]|uniref:hypothetical protein n=1 Tax=Ruania suaedae TaxID=2897774 RepID=UPI001E290E57|nr:hypothetical protein [Ruania suaedae]UFU03964.1 hypothetical protein LQF12_05020 [Ruania suaedae]
MSTDRRSRPIHRLWWCVGAVAFTAAAWAIGLDLARALLLTGAIAAAALLVQWLAFATHSPWPVLPYGRRDGARRDVASLTWMMESRGRLSETGARRLHRAITATLALAEERPEQFRQHDQHGRRHHDLAQEIFGPEIAHWLERPDQAPPPTRAGAQAAIAAAETLLHPDPRGTR